MSTYSERIQLLVSKEQRRRLERIARERKTSVNAVIRDAVDAQTAPPRARSRREALDALYALNAPVDDWEVMEQEIIDAATECLPPS